MPVSARRLLDQPLDQIDRFRTAGAAIDRRRRRVGENRAGADMNRLHVVEARNEHQRPEQRRGRGAPPIGAERLIGARADREKLSVGVERKLGVDELIAGVIVEQQAFAARRRPFDRPAAALRGPQHQHVVGIDIGLHAEAAADIRRQHSDLRLRHVKHRRGQCGADAVRILRSCIEREFAVGGVVDAERSSAARSDWR